MGALGEKYIELYRVHQREWSCHALLRRFDLFVCLVVGKFVATRFVFFLIMSVYCSAIELKWVLEFSMGPFIYSSKVKCKCAIEGNCYRGL